jgi:protein SCO1/2
VLAAWHWPWYDLKEMSANPEDQTMSTKCRTKTGRFAFVLSAAFALMLLACGGGPSQQTATPAATPAAGSSQGQRYHLAGTIVSIDKEQKHLIVNAGDIPGFMAAMTMPYPVADEATLNRVGVGDQITADIVVANGEGKLENVVVVKKGDGKAPAASPSGENRQPGAGDKVPNFALLNQDGKQVHLDQFHGKAVLLTFIYTRCPLPDYCPLMSHNFAQIEKNLTQTPELYKKTHLLSISFDPKYDTPPVLRKYADSFVADPKKPPFDHWEFVAITPAEQTDIARFFNLFLSNDGPGQIGHSMATAIITPDGQLYRTYPDNSWKPADVLNDLTAAAAGPAQERSALPSSQNRS